MLGLSRLEVAAQRERAVIWLLLALVAGVHVVWRACGREAERQMRRDGTWLTPSWDTAKPRTAANARLG